MKVLEVLQSVSLGNSVAEFDDALERYFVETETFRQIVKDNVDIVAGDKGTGKTALFRILYKRYTTIQELKDVEVLPAFNPSGNPVFQRLNDGPIFDEGQYVTLWKSYFLSLAGNWIINLYEDELTPAMSKLRSVLDATGLLNADASASTVFSSIVNLWHRITNPRAVEAVITIGPHGIPVIMPRLELGDVNTLKEDTYVPHDEAFAVLNESLEDVGVRLWMVLDRLDEAFAGRPAAEVPALRALLRTYLDLTPYTQMRLKLFVRNDLFRRVTAGGFVNLTHVNAKRMDITWDEESLRDLLYRRLKDSAGFVRAVGCSAADPDCLFKALLPAQVDAGERKPLTWRWMMGRIADGNEVRPPRNLIDLMRKTLDSSIRREERDQTDFKDGVPVLYPESFKAGLRALSDQRVNDTLLAEAGDRTYLVERFRDGKAEQNDESLAAVLGIGGRELNEAVEFLTEIGFLGRSGASYKVPSLYRDGLKITQGKAFDPEAEAEDD